MNAIQIEPTKSTPQVIFDPVESSLLITGQSYPENAFKFYEPIIEMLETYFAEGHQGLKVQLSFRYINTSSSKCLMSILDRLEEAHIAQHQIAVIWYVDPENESEQECAEEFQEDATFSFQIVPHNS